MNPLVEIVFVNWRRPENIKKLVLLARTQTIPAKVTLVDAHLEDQYALPAETLDQFDTVFRWTKNYGGWNRYVPIGGYTCPYTLMIDDDVEFREGLVEHFLAASSRMSSFAMLGMRGRRWPQGHYLNEHILRSPQAFEPVDCVIAHYFVPTHLLGYVIVDTPYYRDLPFIGHHDDIVACTAITRHTGLRCYLTPSDLKSTPTDYDSLPQNDAQWHRPGADAERVVVADRAVEIGYPCLYP